MKKIVCLLVMIITSLILIQDVDADNKNLVNIYLFHSNTCPHCREEIAMLDKLVEDYDNVKVYKYEISDKDNGVLMEKASEIYGTKITRSEERRVGK